MKTFKLINRIALVILAGLLVSCSNPEGDFKKAEQANTEQAYAEFIVKHPQSPLAAQAKAWLTTNVYAVAVAENSINGYESFLRKYPDGGLANEIKSRLGVQLEERDWSQVLLANTVDTYVAFATNHPGSHRVTVLRGKLLGHAYLWSPPGPHRLLSESELRFALSTDGENPKTIRMSAGDAGAAGLLPVKGNTVSYNSSDQYSYSDALVVVVENATAGRPATLIHVKFSELTIGAGSSTNADPANACAVVVALIK